MSDLRDGNMLLFTFFIVIAASQIDDSNQLGCNRRHSLRHGNCVFAAHASIYRSKIFSLRAIRRFIFSAATISLVSRRTT